MQRHSKPKDYRVLLSDGSVLRIVAVAPRQALARANRWCLRREDNVTVTNIQEVN